MKNLKLLLGLFLSLSLLNGCSWLCVGNPDWAVSPERIDRENLSDGISKLKAICGTLPETSCTPDKLEIIGHGAASFRHYPMDVSSKGKLEGNNWSFFHRADAEKINDLMDLAFADNLVGAIEIDAQLPDTSHPLCMGYAENECAFVMHNTPDWEKITKETAAFGEIRENRLTDVLKHFVQEGYQNKNKRLYLEMKSSLECDPPIPNAQDCSNDPARVARIVREILGKSSPGKSGRNWLTVISFSASSLSAFRQELGPEFQDRVDYALIAGYDWKRLLGIKASLAQCKGPVPQFDLEMQDFASLTPWLDSLWFSTKAITRPNKIFSRVVDKRAQYCRQENGKKCEELYFSVASYDRSENNFKKSMAGKNKFVFPLTSIMIDLDDQD